MNLQAHGQIWFLNPAHWPGIEAMLAESARVMLAEGAEPLSKRPAMDWWGDPIAQMRMDGPVAVIPVKGALLKGAAGSDKKAGFVGYDDVAEDIDAAMAGGAKAIVLDIASPGGTAVGAGELGRKVADVVASGVKVVSFTDSMQCSAAEYLSAAASERYATADAIVGSIGTIMTTVSYERMLENHGIKAKVFQSGKLKGAGHPLKDLTEEQESYLQGFVDTLGGEFKAFMKEHRKDMPDGAMEGQVFTGRQGVENGLLDGNFSSLGNVVGYLKSVVGS